MKNKILSLLFSLMCLNGLAQTGSAKDDHLEPDDGYFSMDSIQYEYYANIRSIMFKGLAERPRVRFIVLPTFLPSMLAPSIFQIERDPQYRTNTIVIRGTRENIWEAKDKSKIEVESSRKRLSQDDAELIEKLYRNALLKTQFVVSNSMRLVDSNAIFYFNVNESRRMSGKLSPPRGPNMRELVSISNEIIKEVSSSTFVELSAPLRTRIKELTAALLI